MVAVMGSKNLILRITPSPPRNFPCAAGTAADGKFLDPYRMAQFHDLGIGDAGIGHMRMHGGAAVEIRPGPGAAADGLVILVCGVAEEEIIHRRLGGGADAHGAEQAPR